MSITLQSPEVLLNHMNNRLLSLRGAVDAYLEKGSLTTELTEVMRKLIIAQLLHDRFLIAVAGSQGAGKTTLIQRLYGLDKRWIDGNEGRGEKSPLLVLEKEGISEPEAWIDKLEKTPNGFQIKKKQLTEEAFRQALRGELPDQIIPTLYVPPTYFSGHDRGFILLPGYEAKDKKNTAWQGLMRQSLVGSSMCLVVTDETRLANSQQKEILRDMYQHYLSGAKPMVIIAKTENNSPQEREELCQTAAQVFDINSEEMKLRVLCTGTGGAFEETWWPQFIDKLYSLSEVAANVRTRQLDHLGTILREDLLEVLLGVDDTLRERDHSGEVKDYETFMAVFDDAVKKLRKTYQTSLDRSLRGFADTASKKAVDKYIDDEEGFLNGIGNMFRWLFTSSGEREKIPGQIVNGAWRGPSGKGFAPHYLDTIGGITSDRLGLLPGKAVDGKQSKELLGYWDSSNQPLALKVFGEAEESNLKSIFFPLREGNEIPLNKEAQRSVALLPVLALEFARISGIFPGAVGVNPKTMVKESNLEESLGRVQNDFKLFSNAQMNLIKGIAVMLAIDGAVDGKIDTIPALFSAISGLFTGGGTAAGGTAAGAGAGGAAGAAAGASTAVAAAGVIAIGFLAVAVTREIQRQDAGNRDLVRRIVYSIRDAHLEHYITGFDELMDKIRDTLNDRLRVRYHLDEKLMQYDRVAKPLADVRSLRSDMLEAINGAPSLQMA